MAVNLEGVFRALADQISSGIERDTNVNAFPDGSFNPPQITVYPPSGSLNYWQTFGPNGAAALTLRLKLEVDSDDTESIGIKICDYLGVGTGNTSSIIDAVMADRTIGGTVEDAAILTAEWGDPDVDPGVAWLDVQVILKKQNAEA